MRVLVAGASGAIGRALVPALLARGHEVAGLVRSEEGGASVADQGAEPLIADALEPLAVMACFERFRPDAVAHQLTALTAASIYVTLTQLLQRRTHCAPAGRTTSSPRLVT